MAGCGMDMRSQKREEKDAFSEIESISGFTDKKLVLRNTVLFSGKAS